jgi:hypothetical protein
VGIQEIAERTGRTRGAVSQLGHRGLLPEHQWTVGGRRAWDWPVIEAWIRETGRLSDVVEDERWATSIPAACARDGGWPSVAAAAAALGLSHHTTRRYLQEAVEAGVIVASPGAGNASRFDVPSAE